MDSETVEEIKRHFGARAEDLRSDIRGRMRHVKMRPNAKLNARALGALVDAAYVDIKSRLDLERFMRERARVRSTLGCYRRAKRLQAAR